MRNFFLIIALLACIAGGYWVYHQKIKPAQALQASRQTQSYVVRTGTVRETLTLSGKIDASEKAVLNFPVGGRITWIGVKRGDMVKQYQGVASIDSRTAQKQIEQQLNNFMTTRWQFDQTKDDNRDAPFKDSYIGDKLKRAIDISQFGLNNSVLQVEIATIAKEASYLWSPINGVMVDVAEAPVGSYANPATTTYTVVNPRTLHFVALADQTEVGTLRVGQQAQLSLDAYANTPVMGTITFVSFSPKSGESGTVYEVFLNFPLPADYEKYKLGMTGDATFTLKEKQKVIQIPSEYIKIEGKKRFVTVRTKDALQKREVSVGIESDGFVEVTKGLSIGDEILENTP